ncbi:MAG: hypothetical protein AB7O43_08715 [Hyphomicrobiaceae bacterium]
MKDMLQEIPLSAVMRERVALAEQKYEFLEEQVASMKRRIADLERENAELRANTSTKTANTLSAETARVLWSCPCVSGHAGVMVGLV